MRASRFGASEWQPYADKVELEDGHGTLQRKRSRDWQMVRGAEISAGEQGNFVGVGD